MNARDPGTWLSRIPAVLLLAAAALAPGMAPAQQGPPQPVKWSIALDPASGQVPAGGRLAAVVTARIGDGWHVYAPDKASAGPRPVEIRIVRNPIFTVDGTVGTPKPEREMDEAFGQITASYTETAVFRVPVAVAAEAAAGAQLLEIEISFQACDGNICLPAKATRVKATVTITRPGDALQQAGAGRGARGLQPA
jgi:DsbC/DsbD-like thiol-disulfide interchange protein